MRRLAAILIWLAWSVPALAVDPWFEVERLNEGLGPAPEALDRSTPQSTLEALIDLSRDGNFTVAAHLLDLSALEESEQPQLGPILARMLEVVIDRKVIVDWSDLEERPDALDENATADSALAGQPRRSIRLWTLDVGDRAVAIRMNRIKPGDGEAVWVFSRQTVDNIEALYALHGPNWLERRMPAYMVREAFWGMRWWEVIAFPLVLLLAFAAGYAAYRGLSALARRTERKVARDIVNATRVPAIILTVTLLVAFAKWKLFVFSGLIDTILSPLIALGFVWTALHLVVKVIDAVLDRLVRLDDMDLSDLSYDRNRKLATRFAAIRRGLIVVIALVGTGIVLNSANVFESFGFSLLASAGVLTLILGFAARNILGNIMASMQIAVNQSAKIGDKVVFKGHICNVERIHFTYVQLREWTGLRLVVPVEEFVSDTFENWSMQDPELTRLIVLKLHHDAEIEPLREAFLEIAEEMDQNELSSPEDRKVAVTGQDAFGQEVTFCLPCANPDTAWDMECRMRERLIRRAQELAAEGRNVFPEVRPAEAA